MDFHKPVHINRWLLPFSWLYGGVLYLRNKLFKWGIYKQKEYDIPIICVGNISVGGTGKTPHTEYLVALLKDKYKVAILSRGYKRKTKGFILSTKESTSREIGDEPYQIKQKFSNTIVAVDKNRRRGIKKLLALANPPQVIILDDGFQHRYVKPSYSIILSDYNRPIYEDKLLPAGRLREPIGYIEYATDIIVSKCPEELQPIEYRLISRDINPFPYQRLFFTTFKYQKLKAVFNTERLENLELKALKGKHVLLVTGIASPKPLLQKISEYTSSITSIEFGDHHAFTNKDIKKISSRFQKIKTDDKIIIVTEKDACRLHALKVDDSIRFYFYYLPIEVSFLEPGHREGFDQRILKHVEENTRNS